MHCEHIREIRVICDSDNVHKAWRFFHSLYHCSILALYHFRIANAFVIASPPLRPGGDYFISPDRIIDQMIFALLNSSFNAGNRGLRL